METENHPEASRLPENGAHWEKCVGPAERHAEKPDEEKRINYDSVAGYSRLRKHLHLPITAISHHGGMITWPDARCKWTCQWADQRRDSGWTPSCSKETRVNWTAKESPILLINMIAETSSRYDLISSTFNLKRATPLLNSRARRSSTPVSIWCTYLWRGLDVDMSRVQGHWGHLQPWNCRAKLI